jgi:lactoylglutathione lyase
MRLVKIAVLASPIVCAGSLFVVRSAPNPPPLTFDHTTVYVRDLQRSADFYEKAMGFERIPEPFHDGKHVWFRIGAREQLHVVSGATAQAEPPIEVHFAFRVGSMAEFTAHMDAMKVKYRSFDGKERVTNRPDGVHQTYLQDPDGYWIEVNDEKF